MRTRATLRVTTQSGDPGRPERDRLEAAASKLSDRGFQVDRIGRFGVSVEGSAETFEKELGVRVNAQESLVTPIHPAEPSLAELVDLVEVASTPLTFTR